MKQIILLLVIILLFITKNIAQSSSITGFNASNARQQLSIEKQFDQNLNAAHIGSTIKLLSSYPHHLGSPGDKAVADTIYNRFKQYGWDVRIDEYTVLFPTPKTRVLEMVSPTAVQSHFKRTCPERRCYERTKRATAYLQCLECRW